MDNKTRCSVLCRGFQGAQRRAEETGHSSFGVGGREGGEDRGEERKVGFIEKTAMRGR